MHLPYNINLSNGFPQYNDSTVVSNEVLWMVKHALIFTLRFASTIKLIRFVTSSDFYLVDGCG